MCISRSASRPIICAADTRANVAACLGLQEEKDVWLFDMHLPGPNNTRCHMMPLIMLGLLNRLCMPCLDAHWHKLGHTKLDSTTNAMRGVTLQRGCAGPSSMPCLVPEAVFATKAVQAQCCETSSVWTSNTLSIACSSASSTEATSTVHVFVQPCHPHLPTFDCLLLVDAGACCISSTVNIS